MKTGPKPKPTSLKLLSGNPGHRKLPAHEPRPGGIMPACPSFLRGEAKKEWKRLAPELYILGLLTKIDRASLAAYCQNYGRWLDAEKQLAKLAKMSKDRMGYLYRTTNGNLIINPLLSVSNKAQELMYKFLVEFGMTPASRTRTAGGPPGQEQDETDKLLNVNRLN